MDNRVKVMIRKSSLETIANYFDTSLSYHVRKTKTKYVKINNAEYTTFNDYEQICKNIIKDTVLNDFVIDLLLPDSWVLRFYSEKITLSGLTYEDIELLMLNPLFDYIEFDSYNERKYCLVRFSNDTITYKIPIKEDRKYSPSSYEAKMKLIEKWLAD